MAKPRIFISSTYYDLKHIRASLEAFIDSLGYEAILFESGDIAFRHDQALDDSCYQEVRNCHMLILIIGNRYGSATTDDLKITKDHSKEDIYKRFNSITKKEYDTARERDIPIFIFVDKNVLAEHHTYKRNRENNTINYAYVDNVNIFYLLDDILMQNRNNFIRGFENFDDISTWLRDQWAGLFADFLSRTRNDSVIADISSQIGDLKQVTSILREYSELIIQKIKPDNYERIISEQQLRLRKSNIEKFTHEAFINYLRNILSTESIDSSASVLYDHFIQSISLYDFFLRIGFAGNKRDEFLEVHRNRAEESYATLSAKYKRQDSTTDNTE